MFPYFRIFLTVSNELDAIYVYASATDDYMVCFGCKCEHIVFGSIDKCELLNVVGLHSTLHISIKLNGKFMFRRI